jgi:heme/copper-type cytochrome/quinol oxidase subunit 2
MKKTFLRSPCERLRALVGLAAVLALIVFAAPAAAAGAHATGQRPATPGANGKHSLVSTALTIAILVALAAGVMSVYLLARRHERNPARARERGH